MDNAKPRGFAAQVRNLKKRIDDVDKDFDRLEQWAGQRTQALEDRLTIIEHVVARYLRAAPAVPTPPVTVTKPTD